MVCFTVIYQSGVLKPTESLNLPEGQQLQIQIVEASLNLNPLEAVLQPLILSGALTLPQPTPQLPLPEVPFPSLVENELEAYGTDTPSPNLLSDSIIEDRGAL